MDMKSDDVDWRQDCRPALPTLIDSGTHLDAQNVQLALTLIPTKVGRLGKFDPLLVRIGNTIAADGFSSTEVRFKRLSFHAIDYGDKLRTSDLIKRKLRKGYEFGNNQCANLRLSDAVEWRFSGRTSRVPSNHRVCFCPKNSE